MSSPTACTPDRLRHFATTSVLLALALSLAVFARPARAQNAIVTENLLPGSPASAWDISGAGDLSIQGFATDISVNRGQTVTFKIKTDAAAYHVDIYRLGYYQGLGARLMSTPGVVTATLPQAQPADQYDATTGLTDCSNWAESAHWNVPADAVSGIYIAKLTRDDTGGASHIVFVVRDDASTSHLLFQTSDATWQAYNVYGGNSLYVGSVAGYPGGHATKVSYDRPFVTRNGGGGGGVAEDWLFNAEYPMVRWLEANGYDVTYTTDVDSDRRGNLIAQHGVFMSVGHDEYWSGGARAHVEAARDAGTHLAFFSGNEVYWKTRWEPNGAGTDYRTLVCYKEGTLGENVCGGKCDPLAGTWTGLWRDGCAFTGADGCRPENALSGQISWDGNTGTLEVSDAYKNLRFWRGTSVASLGTGQSATLTAGTLGYEWDWDQYDASYPAGRVKLSSTSFDGHTHNLSLYRAASGALVFGAGTVQWAWGLDSHHDRGSAAADPAMQQATINLLAEMGAQPATVQSGLTAVSATGDATPPASTILSPAPGASLPTGTTVVITGTAADAAGVVAGVEVSVDGGATWSAATGTASWSFAWTPATTGSATIKVRAVDDLGNLEAPGTAPAANAVAVTVTQGSLAACPCTVFPATTPALGGVGNDNNGGIELGMRFRVSQAGLATGVRFWKDASMTGTHLGHLWTNDGTQQLAEVTFTNETASGWQEASFTTPVAVTAGVTYVVSAYSPNGAYPYTNPFFTADYPSPTAQVRGLASGTDLNGIYLYGASGFPTSNYQSSNYWVDVVFDIPSGPDVTPPTVTATSPGSDATGVPANAPLTATFSEALDPATVTTSTFELHDAANALVVAAVAYDAPTRTATLTPGTLLVTSATYTARLAGGATGSRIKDLAGNALAADYTWSFTTTAPDQTPPTVLSTVPAANAAGVLPGASVNAVFSEALNPVTVSATTFDLHDGANALVPATVSYNVYTNTATLAPAAALAAGSYTARLAGGGSPPHITDLAGNALATDVTWTFTVGNFARPEAAGWYVGDMHTHRSCGGAPVTEASLYDAMVAQDVSLISLLADMGNGEVQTPATDLPLVNGQDDPISTGGRIIHWDAEWHWDATYSQYAHQALGGHLINLGLTEAHTIWDESTAPVAQWARQQGGISGFAHMQYLPSGFPTTLTCCTPVEYPVEVALGNVNFISEDVGGGDVVIDAYYRLLNCGFRPGLAAGSDNPCGATIGQTLTFGRTPNGQLSYRGWIDAIAAGRTVVSRVGRGQFLDLRVNGTSGPGDDVHLASAGDVQVTARWTAAQSLNRTIELVHNGVVVATRSATAAPGAPDSLTATVNFPASGWLCARVMGSGGHEVHTAAVFVTVAGAPVRASASDAQFYVQWMDNLITNTSPGGIWNSYFPTELAAAQARYQAARTVYQQIAAGAAVTPLVVTSTPADGATAVAATTTVTASFSEALDAATVTGATFLLADAAHNAVAATVAYDAVTHVATLTPGAPLAPLTVYTAKLAGGATSPNIKDLAGNALAADVTWSFTTAAPDLTPPTVLSTVPVANAAGVAPGASVNAIFSEALSPASVAAATFELHDGANALVPATVSYNVATHTATLAPTAALAGGSYTARLVGGGSPPHITDLAGNALAADFTWTFTVSAYNCPCTVWSPTTVPGTVDEPDANSLELGLKFRTAVDGWITGVRYYKSAANTGAHTGSLWSRTGTLLASVTFTGETSTGWQEVSFGSPVAVTANTTYLVSYHTNVGHYAADVNYFASAVDNGPLHAMADGEDGPNAVYSTGEGGFPTLTYLKSNYWVDPVFATSVGPDVTPPVVAASVPANGATAVSASAALSVSFSEAIDPSTVSASTVLLLDSNSAVVPTTVTYDVGTRTALLNPLTTLAYSSAYTLRVKGGGTDPRIKDLAGNALASDYSAAFTTSAPPPPPPTEGPGGPILVLSAASNPFSRYPVEILRAEGLNEFTAKDISLVDATELATYDVVVLGDMPLTTAQVTLLTDWTNAGGTLIAFRPDKQLAGLMGLTATTGTLANQYLLVNTASGPGVGIVGQTIQFHGTADLYTLNGATAVATLYSSATVATSNPAITQHAVGSNGGQAYAFTYDLARSVVYTRQGNPAWAGQKRDGQIPPIRSDDQYFGNASFDPQPDWVDLNKVAIPQADEQQRLLANAITLGNMHRKPLPRFWYLPKGLKAAIVETGDDHGDAGMQPRFDIYRNESVANCSVDDWECVRATGYLYVGSTFTDAQALFYHNMGFEVALHVLTNCANFTQQQYQDFITSQMAVFHAAFPSIPLPVTNRNHCIAWSDWSMTPEVEAANGIRFDTNYYYWPSSWILDRPGMFTGSGIPMRFAKLDGTIIDCFQAATEMPDESGESFPAFSNGLLDKATGPEGYYGVFTTNMHFDNPNHPGSNAVVASAQAHGVPVVSAKQMLTWLDGRNGSSFGNLAWSGNTLGFSIAAATGSRNMRAMLPTQAAVGQLTGITLGGTPVAYTTQTIKGIEYAFFPADAGNYVAQYAVDTTPPLVSAVSATPHTDGTATVTWTTNEVSNSRVDYGTTAEALGLSATDAAMVTSHSVTLAGLSPSTTYYFRVTSADLANNAATEPPLTSSALSFATPAPVCFQDQTTADFAAGTAGTGVSVTTIGDGDVTLQAGAAAEFTVLPPTNEWQSFPWTTGGTSTVSGGLLTVDGARFNTEPVSTTFSPGTSVEFRATFNAAALQHMGFAAGDDGITNGGIFNAAPWAIFSTGTGGSQVLARVNVGGTLTDYAIPLSLLGAAHTYRVDWKSTSVDFYVDGALVHTETVTITGAMRVAIADYTVGGQVATVDWIHVSPYAASGSFTSRVYDGGGTSAWGAMSWTASVPTGTSLQMFERQGNISPPDGSWTAYAPIAASGNSVGGSSRYIQYRADLATTVSSTTPVLQDVHISCSAGTDVTPPAISAVTATPTPGGSSATIGWTTDELATSRVDYGTSAGALTLNVTGAGLVGTHALTLTGLTPSTTYYYRVTSADAAGNSTMQPAPPATLNFATTTPPCISDVTAADFAAGTTGAATYVSETAGGEVILQPAAGAEFSGTALPSGWETVSYGGASSMSVSGGHVSVDGAYVATTALYGPGRSVEFVATFDATAAGQHAGFGFDVNAAPWALFSTHGGGVLEARANDGTETNTPITGVALGVPHRFRIDWSPTQLVYSVDGAVVATQPVAIAANMRPIVSDGPVGGNPLQADWIRMTPYAASGSYTSRVFDSGGATAWSAASWTSALPAGTALAMLARTGNTAVPDASWSAFTTIPSSGSSIGASSRYLQYRADLSTSDATVTPELRDVSIACTTTADVTPPVISNVVATSATDGLSATITWTTDEQATSRVDYGTTPGALTLNALGALLGTSHSVTLTGLAPATTYYYRVTSVDPFANSATQPAAPATASFATQSPPCAVDVTAADFAGGTPGAGTYISATNGGEVILQPAVGAEFDGTALPSGWTSGIWTSGGTVTVGGGLLTVDGTHASSTTTVGPGSSMEFVATFTAAQFQNVGFAADGSFNSPWVTIGLGLTTGGVYARRDDGADVLLSASTLGTPHRYRIDWTASTFVFWVDGVQVGTMTKTVGTNMVPIVSDFNAGGPVLTVDWLHVTPPYAPSGSYTSRVFDSGGTTTWGAASWTSVLPAGTSLGILVRRGSTPAPDANWTAFAAIPSSGSSVGGSGRYLQYRADLATTDVTVTPELRDITIQCLSTPDVTPPVISSVTAVPAADGLSATVTWTTDELSTSRVDYGTSTGSLSLNASDASPVTAHSVTLTGLSTGTTYYYRVTSVDGSSNSGSSPASPATANFFTPAPCPSDQTAAYFGLGTLDANTAISLVGDGEIMLKPAYVQEFTGSALPADWQSGNGGVWTGGTATVGSGSLTVNGAHAGTTTLFTPIRSVEFVATFRAEASQHVGFTADFAFSGSFAIFSTYTTGTGVYARAGTTNTLISSSLLGSPHRYRIDWKATSFDFYVDGSFVTTIPQTISANMLVQASDVTTTGNIPLTVDWLRVTPYATSGSFTSRIFNQGGPSNWGVASWNAYTPSGTNLAMLARTGNTATPDGTWSAFLPLTNGLTVGGNSRYLQYRADLSTTLPGWTPELQDMAIACVAGPDVTPPAISGVAAAPALNGQSAVITWTTDEPSDSRVDYGTNSGALLSSASDASLVRSHMLTLTGLSPGFTYYYRVTSADGSLNSASSPVAPGTLSFTAPMPACFVDQLAADFALGTTGTGTYVSLTADGEVIAAPALGDEFSGTTLSSTWTSPAWATNGASTVSGGRVTVDGARLTPLSTTGYGAGHALEFMATFAVATANQHIGFGSGDNTTSSTGMFNNNPASWAMFSTKGGGSVQARINIANTASDVDLGASYLGSPHLYRIEWKALPDSIIFLIDGTSVRRVAAVFGVSMRPGASDLTVGGAAIVIDWIRMTPYTSGGTFTSRVYDSGATSSWGAMTWTADVPSGTSLTMSARKGNTATPDGTWSAFAPVASSGATVGGIGRYIQYSAAFTSNATLDQTPALKDVSIACGACNSGAPAVLANLAASATGNAGGGRSNVRLSWSGTSAGDVVAVYRKGYGDYPLYRGDHGGVPAPPATPAAALAANWALTGVTTTGGMDAPPTRDAWYYVAYVTNSCGVTSGPSNLTTGAVDYVLGDVSNGTTVCARNGEAGDGAVTTLDMSALGSEYGNSFTATDDRICLDVGPTVDYGIRSRPQPDGRLDFEDLVVYALNFGVPLPAAPAAAHPAAQRAGSQAATSGDLLWVVAPDAVRAGDPFDVVLRVRGSGTLHAISAQLAWAEAVAQPTGTNAGTLLESSGGIALSPSPGAVDVAVLGASAPGFTGDGDLAVFHFRALADGGPAVRIAGVTARDAANQAVTPATTGTPPPAAVHVATSMGAVFPNPFRGALNVSFSLARETRVTLTVFDLAGRAVRKLDETTYPAGTHLVAWDGRSDAGHALAPGIYVVRFMAGDIRQTRRVQLVR